MILRVLIAVCVSLLLPAAEVSALNTGGCEERIEVTGVSSDVLPASHSARHAKERKHDTAARVEPFPAVSAADFNTEDHWNNTYKDLYLRYRRILI